MTDILEEFLSVGKLEEGKIEAHLAYVEIPELVNDTLADVSNLLRKIKIYVLSTQVKQSFLRINLC